MRTKIAASIAVLLGLLCGLLIAYMFRTRTLDNPDLGLIYYKYRWGFAHEVQADTNRDGSVDYRALFGGTSRTFWTPIEYWEDRNYDGLFEVHVLLEDTAIQRVELDENGDGSYERILTGEEARGFYDSLIQESEEDGQ